MAENRSPNPPRRSGRINIGEPARKLGSWCSGAELDGEEQKSQATCSTSRSSQSARVAARKLREAKLHAEEAKALLEKENLEKQLAIDKRLVASRLALEEAKLAEELSLPSSSLSLRSTSTRSQQLNPASVREGKQELTISALAKHTAEQQSSHVIIKNEHAVTRSRSADDGSSETTESEQLLPSWCLNNSYSSAYIRPYPASVRCPDPSLASLTSSRAASERCQNTSGRSHAVQQVKSEQTVMSAFAAEPSTNKPEQTVEPAFVAEPSRTLHTAPAHEALDAKPVGQERPPPRTRSALPVNPPDTYATPSNVTCPPMHAQAGYLSYMNVKPLEIPKFNGKQRNYLQWRQCFQQVTNMDTRTTENYKLAQLRAALAGGEAEELVAGVIDGPGAYAAVLAELESWYGGPMEEVAYLEQELMAWPKISSERDWEALKVFALKLRNTLINLHVCNIRPGRELYLTATQKVPRSILSSFFDKYDDRSCNLDSFSAFLMTRVQRSKRVEERLNPSLIMSEKEPARRQKPAERTFAATVDDKHSCRHCSGQHHLASCAHFQKLSVRQRWSVVKPTNLCLNCLKPGHRCNSCLSAACKACSKKHHALLHPVRDTGTARQKVEQTHAAQTSSTTFMAVPVCAINGSVSSTGTGLLDSASSTSYIRESFARTLGLIGEKRQLNAAVLGGNLVSGCREYVDMTVVMQDGNKMQLGAWVLPVVTGPIEELDYESTCRQWKHLAGIGFKSIPHKDVDVLIGLNATPLHAALEERRSNLPSAPIARCTPLGWVCFGPGESSKNSTNVTLLATERALDDIVQNFWKVEATTSSPGESMSMADRIALEKTEQSMTYDGERFSFGIPWLQERGSDLENNYYLANHRLKSLERSLAKRPDVAKEYARVLAAHEQKGYISEVPAPDRLSKSAQWFLPHFPVVRSDKTTTKVRVVFDAAAPWNGVSLNDTMHTGPALQGDIVDVLLRFSLEPVSLVGDISEMFLQVGIKHEDRRYHRFLWREEPTDEIKIYEFNRVVFGVKASPFLACKAVKEVVSKFGADYDSSVTTAIDRSFYVDDLLGSLVHAEAAIDARLKIQELLAKGGFHIRKWLSNSKTVMDSIPPEDRAPGTVLDVGIHDHCTLPVVKTLGLSWIAEEDVFTFRYNVPEVIGFTKRSALKGLATVFDPRGLIAPFTIRSRIMFQDAWLLQSEWDDRLPQHENARWTKWFAELPDLQRRPLKIDRCFKSSDRTADEAQLSVHTFSDASDRAIAAVSYIRAQYPDGYVKISLAMAKAKAAPIRRLTIPQLELRGAVLAVHVSQYVQQALDLPISQHGFWTDSMNVLGWLQSHSRRFKVDIGNRISEIQGCTTGQQWRHISGKVNPADKATRGLSAKALVEDKGWWHGPAFLVRPESEWPTTKSVDVTDLPGVLKRELCNVADVEPVDNRLTPERFSSWIKLTRVTAWCKRFAGNALKSPQLTVKGEKSSANSSISIVNARQPKQSAALYVQVDELTVTKLKAAEKWWIASAQGDCYSDTIQHAATSSVPRTDPHSSPRHSSPRHSRTLLASLLSLDSYFSTSCTFSFHFFFLFF